MKAAPQEGEDGAGLAREKANVPKATSAPQADPATPPPSFDPASTLRDKFDRLQESVAKLAKKSDDSSAWTAKDVASIISALTAIIAVAFSYRSVSVSREMSLTQIRQNVKNERAKMLQTKLDGFYGALVQLRNTSNLLYDVFRSRQPDPNSFRTLTALLSGVQFEGNDKVLLDEIIKIGEETENLILKSSGLVDEDIQPLLGKATTHYRILRLAHGGMLKGEPEKYQEHVYPRELDAAIAAKIGQIRSEIASLTKVDANAFSIQI